MDNRSDNVCDLCENQEEKISKTHKRNAQRQKYSKRVGGLSLRLFYALRKRERHVIIYTLSKK